MKPFDPSALNRAILILDCQTTGISSVRHHLLEVGWGIFNPNDPNSTAIHSNLVQLPEGVSLTDQIQELTGISELEMKNAIAPEVVLAKLKSSLATLGIDPIVVIHYAQFEKRFLQKLFAKSELPFEIICSQRLSQKVFPRLPSHNLRAIAGFLGLPSMDSKRSGCHVQATLKIWQAILPLLHHSPKFKAAPQNYEYRIEKLARLALPDSPGLYRMIAQDGKILYIGKATSLRSRVNSYFRGKKGRDRRKLEMLAQVWDLQIVECTSALEAALLETDEIKKWNPPYNVSLKAKGRKLIFYDRAFENQAFARSSDFCLGPFRPLGPVDIIKAVQAWTNGSNFPNFIFHQELGDDLLIEGFLKYRTRSQLPIELLVPHRFRSLCAWSLHQLRAFQKLHPGAKLESIFAQQKLETEKNDILSSDDVADKFARIFLRAGAEIARSRRLTKLFNSNVFVSTKDGLRRIEIRNGNIAKSAPEIAKASWSGDPIGDFDRMSVLLSEIERHGFKVDYNVESGLWTQDGLSLSY